MSQTNFIDTHCHLFNIGDIPLYETVMGNMPSGLLIALGWLSGIIRREVKKRQLLIEYFERERSENINLLEQEMGTALRQVLGLGANVTRIVTPLIMDFEKGAPNERLAMQELRLREAIRESDQVDGFKVLPFLGIDLRRLHSMKATELMDWAHKLVDDGRGQQVRRLEGIADRGAGVIPPTGSFVGIKLYPPLGFCPLGWCPAGERRCGEARCKNDLMGLADEKEKRRVRDQYAAFFKECENRRIPITVHCQNNGSFHLETDSRQHIFTDPQRWAPILDACNNLIVNFAHFGGEKEICKTIKWNGSGNMPNRTTARKRYSGYRSETWTSTIIRMLKLYPNTFADVAAFDCKIASGHSLACILCLDEAGELDGLLPEDDRPGHKLIDKLMWGTDRPMLLAEGEGKFTNYESQLKAFVDLLDVGSVKRPRHPSPMSLFTKYSGKPPQSFPDQATWIEKLTSTNPHRFLFGQ